MKEWPLADGRSLCYRQAGSGPTLVLLHGWAMSSAVFGEALEELSDQFTVLVPDLPGHGQSAAAADYSLDALAGDLAAWLKGLELTGVRLLGWSLGGQLALRLASLVRPRIHSLLLVSTTPRFVIDDRWTAGLPDGQVRIMARGLKRRYGQTLDDFFAQQFGADELPPDRLQQLLRQLGPAAVPPQAEAALAALETLRCADLRDQLSALQLPALVMHGADDVIIPAAAGRYLAEQLPQSRWELLPQAGHAPFLSRPQRCFALWREFCQR